MKLPKKLHDWPWKLVTQHTTYRSFKGPVGTRKMHYNDGGKEVFWTEGNSTEFPTLLKLLESRPEAEIHAYLLEVVK